MGVSHLNRDMLLAITSRDDFFSSHPANILRGRANNGDECAYNYKFIDQWIQQAEYNGFSYYNIYVGTQWFRPGRNYEEPSEYAIDMYANVLAYLKTKIEEGVVQDMTMGEFADWYRANVPCGQAEVNHWPDLLCESKREMAWYVDPYLRVAIDPNIGGSISDLRPLIGQIEKNVGPETTHMHNGSYPFIISAEHRGGFDEGSIHTFTLSAGDERVEMWKRRTRCRVDKDDDGRHRVAMDPIECRLGELTFSVESVYTFLGQGVIEIERRVFDMSDTGAEVEIEEFHRGCWGDTQYPVPMHGIELVTIDVDGEQSDQVVYNYEYRKREVPAGSAVRATIPQVNAVVTLAPAAREQVDAVAFEEGYMSSPYYTLTLKKKVANGGSLRSWLTIARR